MKHLLSIVALLLVVMLGIPTLAQQEDTEPPAEIEVAFAALEAQTGATITFETVAAFEWAAWEFADASLGCPRPGQTYAQVITPGYQFLLNYADMTYDYRVPQGAETVNSAVLCDSYPAQPLEPDEMPTPSPDNESPCGAYYEVEAGDILLKIADRCETSVDALMAINPDIEDPSLIYPGQRLAIPRMDSPYNVSIAPDSGPPGTTVTLTASGFPPGARVQYGLGRFRAEYDVYGVREIGDSGTLTATMSIPEGAGVGEEWVGLVSLRRQEAISEVFEVTEGALFDQTEIYLVALGDAGRSGIPFGCDDSLVPVTVDIQPTVAPLTAAYGQLFAIDSRTYGQSGLYNALYRSDLSVEGIDIDNGVATVNLNGTLRMGGLCDAPRIEQQLRQTALHYSTIDSISIFVDGQPLAEAAR
jgi:hypothetical protein